MTEEKIHALNQKVFSEPSLHCCCYKSKMDDERFRHGLYISLSPPKCSVLLKDVYKTYNNKIVFNGVNLIAHSGEICAILGDMKSGKSMLLSCIVGGDDVDKGHIWVLGGKPKSKSSRTLTRHVGYMPQEFCLYKTMTILELLLYFGQLYNINHKFILWRMNYYSEIFALPQTNVIVRNLNFSEKRIVSFILAVFHRPRLVVLDEPTVGLDIFKKKQIWKYLSKIITTWKPTVILATNNVEEAFLATKIMYLKKGKIIFEKNVEKLQHMNPNKSVDIIVEDIYTSVMANENISTNSYSAEIPQDKKLSFNEQINLKSNIWKLKAIVFQNMKFLVQNIGILILICVIPILQVSLHCTYYGKYPELLSIAVYNQETDCVYNPCKYIGNCSYFSCHFLNLFNASMFKVSFYDSEYLAKNSIKKDPTLGFIKISKNYTNAIIKSITQNLPKEPNIQSEFGIHIEVDMTNFDFGNYLKENLLYVHRLHLINIYSHYNLSTKYADIPLKIYEYNNLQLAENTVSEIVSCAIFSSAMFYSALLLQSEIKHGYLTRNIIAGVTNLEIVLSFLIIQTIISIIQAFGLFFLVEIIISISWESSLLLIILLNIATGICGMSIGLLIGSFTNSSNKLFHSTLIVYFVNLILSGFFWPFDNIAFDLEQYIATVLPLSMPVKAIKTILIQGRQLKSINILYNAGYSISFWTLISFKIFLYRLKAK